MSGLHQDTAGFGVSDHQHGLSEQETREMLMDQAMVDHDEVPEHELVNELARDDDDEGAMALATAAVDAATAASANEQLQQAGGGSEAHVEQGELGDAEQATSDEPARKRSISQVEQSEQDGGVKPGEDGETFGNGTSAAERASEGGVAATAGARKRGRLAGAQSAASSSGHGKQQADESDAGATSSAGPAAGPGGPGEGGRELTEQERRARQREANRKAAERSRGKKNEELNNLERTVSKIQEENAKLRAQLEMLLDAAGAPAAQTATGGAAETSSSTPGPSTDVMAVESNQDAHPTLSSAATAGVTSNSDEQRPDLSAPPPLALGADGLDLDVLGSLAAEVRSLKAQLAAKRAQMATDAASGAPSTADVDNADVATERAALSALIDHLRESRDAADMERHVLEREIAERRAISKALSTRAQAQAQTPEQQDEEGAAEAESNKDVLREIEEEIRRNRQGAGVERALVEVRSWIDEAIKDWKKTGIIRPPPTVVTAVDQARGAAAGQVPSTKPDEPLPNPPPVRLVPEDFDINEFTNDESHATHTQRVSSPAHEQQAMSTDQDHASHQHQVQSQAQHDFEQDITGSEEYMHLMAAVAANHPNGLEESG